MPRFLLIDDDPIFGRVLCAIAREAGIELTYWDSLVGKSPRSIVEFDLLILDYELRNITAFQLLRTFERMALPTIVVSAHRLERRTLPQGIARFIAKQSGPREIVLSAIQIHEERTDK